jgi:hypothetical protein
MRTVLVALLERIRVLPERLFALFAEEDEFIRAEQFVV